MKMPKGQKCVPTVNSHCVTELNCTSLPILSKIVGLNQYLFYCQCTNVTNLMSCSHFVPDIKVVSTPSPFCILYMLIEGIVLRVKNISVN